VGNRREQTPHPEEGGSLRRPRNSGSGLASPASVGRGARRAEARQAEGESVKGPDVQGDRPGPAVGARPSPRGACRHSRTSAAFLEIHTLSPLRLGCDRSRGTSTGASHGRSPNR